MFTKIGESKWMKFVLFITTFAFVGTALVALIVYKMSGKMTGAVEVNGKEISMQRYMYEVNLIQSNLERQGVDIAPLRKAIRAQALNNIINEELVYQEAEKEGIVATKEEVKQAILNIPVFQENGVFSKDRYLAIVNSMGISPQFFEEILRRQLTRDHVFALIDGATYLTKEELNVFLNKELSQITGKVLVIEPKLKITDKALKEFYKKNISLFTGNKGKDIVVYEISIKDLGKEKAASLAKEVFLSMKNGQPVNEKEGIKKVFEGVLYEKTKLKNIPEKVLKDLKTLSKNKNISFVKTDEAYYLAKFKKEVSKPMPFEKVKKQVELYFKQQKTKEEIEKLYNEIGKDIASGKSLKELKKKYGGKIEKIEKLTLRDISQKYFVPLDEISNLLKTPKGKLSKPVKTDGSVLVIEVDKVEIAKDKKTKELEDMLKKALYNEKLNDLITSYIMKLRKNAEIRINPRLTE